MHRKISKKGELFLVKKREGAARTPPGGDATIIPEVSSSVVYLRVVRTRVLNNTIYAIVMYEPGSVENFGRYVCTPCNMRQFIATRGTPEFLWYLKIPYESSILTKLGIPQYRIPSR